MSAPLEMVTAALEAKGCTGSGKDWQCPAHEDHRKSLSVSEGTDGKVLLNCHAGCQFKAIVAALGLEEKDTFPPKETKAKAKGTAPWNRPVRRAYPYHDVTGTLLFEVVRFDDDGSDLEKCRPRFPDPKGWSWKAKKTDRPLYRLPELLAAKKGRKTIFIPEGEKDVESLRTLGLDATTNPGGAEGWKARYADYLVDADVVLLPDNDEPGRKRVQVAARSLHGKAKRVRILTLQNLPPKGDVSDRIDAGGTLEELLRLAAEAPDWSPVETAEGDNLAGLKALADGYLPKDLESALKTATSAAPSDHLSRALYREAILAELSRLKIAKRAAGAILDKALPPPPPPPPPPPRVSTVDGVNLDGAKLLGQVLALIRRFVVVTTEQAVVITLWVAHTYAVEAADVTPYLAILSAEKRSGKSRLLEVLRLLVRQAWHAIQPSEAVTYRVIHASQPTFLLDETDALFSKSSDSRAEAIRALLNAGHRRGVTVPRCIDHGEDVVHFNVFCPKALAGIGKLPDTIADRSIPIAMKRKKRTETAERFRERDVQGEADALRECLDAWTSHRLKSLRAARPALPDKLSDRAQDGAEPLLALADAAGGAWPAQARAALVALAGERPDDDETMGVELLADVRVILGNLRRTEGFIKTRVLLSELLAREGERWRKCLQGGREPLTDRALAAHLKPYDIRPKCFRDGDATSRGYLVAACLDAFERYLSPPENEIPTPNLTATGATPQQPAPVKAQSVADDPQHDPQQNSSKNVADAVADDPQQIGPLGERSVAPLRVLRTKQGGEEEFPVDQDEVAV